METVYRPVPGSDTLSRQQGGQGPMSSRARIGIVVVAAVVVGYPIAAWVTGGFVQRQLQAREDRALEQVAPYVALVERHYQRSVFGATEVATYGLGDRFANGFKALPGGDALSPFHLTIRNTIRHGPFPGMRAFGLATVDTELVLPEAAQKRVDALLGRKSALASHTSIGWLGTARSEVSIPAFRGELTPGLTVSSGSIAGISTSASDLSSLRGNFSAQGLTFQGEKGKAELAGLEAKASLRRAFSILSVGDVQLTVASLGFHPAADNSSGTQVAARQLELVTHSSVNGDYVDSGAQVSVGSLQAAKFAATQIGYAFVARHLYGPAVASLSEGLRTAAVGSTTDTAGAKQYQEKMQAVLRKDGVELALHDPVVEISRIGFKMPEGELGLSARIAAPGLKRQDFDAPLQVMMASLAQHLQATADVRVDTGLLEKLTESNPNADRFAAQTRALEAQGYITQEGNTLTTHIVFEHGKLALNGKPFPPLPGAGATGPGGPSAPARPPNRR
jgi:uncharacterized protein YdgA (DUF945 family)